MSCFSKIYKVEYPFRGRTKEMDEGKEDMWRQQQEILKARRSGSTEAVDEANSRRQKVQEKVLWMAALH